MKNEVKLFEKKQVRSVWDNENEKYWFSIIDVIAVLTDQIDYEKARNYWKWLKNKLKEEWSELVSITNQLKLQSSDWKFYLTDVADTEGILRLIQSVPSPKAEPFKVWLAKVGNDRLEEIQNPELTVNRALKEYLALGYDEDWINLRLQSIQMRKELTNEWKKSWVKEWLEYAILTDLMTKTWSWKTTKEYKEFKNLKKESLRDNMNNTEIVLNMLVEVSAKEIHKTKNVLWFAGSQEVAINWANIAKNARIELEKQTGKSVLSSKNAKQLWRIKERKKLEK